MDGAAEMSGLLQKSQGTLQKCQGSPIRAREKQEKQEKKARQWTSAVDMGAPALRAVGLSRLRRQA